MKIALGGVSCVGKSTIGKCLAESVGYSFYDFDMEIEKYFRKSIDALRKEYSWEDTFRSKTSVVLQKIIKDSASQNIVIAMPPSGFRSHYWSLLKKHKFITVVLNDKPEHILERITFYDEDSKPIDKTLTAEEKPLYLKEIKKDITWLKTYNKKAGHQFDLAGRHVEESVQALIEYLNIEV